MNYEEFRQQQTNWYQKYFKQRPIFWGHPGALVVSVSQAPSRNVMLVRRPFSDKSGEKLRNEWYKVSAEVFYNPDNFYFTTMSKVFPGKNKKGGDKKPPLMIARKWLLKELEFLHPRVFLIVGQMAAGFLFPKKEFADLVFNHQTFKGIPAYVLPHPSPLNIKWFKDHPEFLAGRLKKVRKKIHRALNLP